MQFIEKNSLNVRSAIYSLTNENSNIEFVLFSMVHIGSKSFYQEVSARLNDCDVIFAEGVKSKKVGLLTLSYEVVKKIKRINLTTQKEALNLSKFGSRVFYSDISKKDFDGNWSLIPILLKISLYLIIPFYILYLFIFGTKDIIAEQIAVEDLQTSDEILLMDKDLEKLDDVLLNKRDKVLIGHIKKLLEIKQSKKTRVGILYGATHMRAISKYLLKEENYRVNDSEWITIFEF